ncbi:DUF4132 domain-containing protein [Kitasatospora griseola]|uniref:DUF4132 domain-containing protein n=1 Tax=Kitasatospora griseola TaxID=2064 RepID=UPI00069801E7|nr:DUF4132 domain-containing protein [Kitasatospora griseola]
MPDLGLSADGTTVIDYGSRTFTVGFDEQLRPFVLAADGRHLRDLPAPGAKDDPQLAPAERKRFTALKKDVRALAADQIHRLEAAMLTGRTWTAAEFRDLLVAHPLLSHLVRRLVWTTTETAFRIAGDRTFADLHGHAFALPDDAAVRLPHPLHLAEDLPGWTELFADGGLTQPFPQLSRPVRTLTPGEAAGHRLHRHENRTVPVGALLGLVKRGWQRNGASDNGVESSLSKSLPGGRWLSVTLDPGYSVPVTADSPDQTVQEVWLGTRPGDWSAGAAQQHRFADLDAVTASELLADLEQLTTS